jgi:hypothetical protein
MDSTGLIRPRLAPWWRGGGVGPQLVEEEAGAERARLVAAGVADRLRRLDPPVACALAEEGVSRRANRGTSWRQDGGAAGWR